MLASGQAATQPRGLVLRQSSSVEAQAVVASHQLLHTHAATVVRIVSCQGTRAQADYNWTDIDALVF